MELQAEAEAFLTMLVIRIISDAFQIQANITQACPLEGFGDGSHVRVSLSFKSDNRD